MGREIFGPECLYLQAGEIDAVSNHYLRDDLPLSLLFLVFDC